MFLAKNAGIKKFVMFSTNGVYQFRQNAVSNPVKEDFPSGLTHHNSYGNSKVVVEYLLRELHEEGSFSGNIIRPGEIYGPVICRPGDEPIYWKGMIDAAISGNEYILSNHPEHRLDWVYCKDVAELAVKLLLTDNTPHIEYNASYGKCMGIYEFKDAIDVLFPGNRVKFENCGVGGWNHPLDMTRAREDFGFVPKYDITAGIQDYVNWWSETDYI